MPKLSPRPSNGSSHDPATHRRRVRRPHGQAPGRRAVYGATALLILVGLTALCFLAANWLNRHYLWGEESAWLDPMRNNGGLGWPFTWFVDGVSKGMLTVKMLVVAALLVLLVIGWRTRVIV